MQQLQLISPSSSCSTVCSCFCVFLFVFGLVSLFNGVSTLRLFNANAILLEEQ